MQRAAAGCSQYVTAELPGAGLATGQPAPAPRLYSTFFTAAALPLQDGDAGGAPPAEFLDHLSDGLLSPARVQGACGSCYSFAITGALRYAIALRYGRLGGYFTPKYLSQQYLISCYQVAGAMCGCNGGDLALALAYLQAHGLPTFLQFPYVNGADDVTPQEASLHYVCEPNVLRGNSLGTCAPCRRDEPSYETVVTNAELASGLFASKAPVQLKTSCIPCDVVGGPLYFPQPRRLYDPARSLDENVAALKRALVQYGPLCTALRVNQKDFIRLDVRAPLFPLANRPVYAPASAPELTSPLHAVIVVGYSDLDRDAAVWVCRNSWGDDFGSFVPDAPGFALDGDGRLVRTARKLGGLFLVAMYRQVEQSALLEHAVSISDVLIQMPAEAAPRALRLDDPFVVPLAGLPDAAPARAGRGLWLVLLALMLLLLAAGAMALLLQGGSS